MACNDTETRWAESRGQKRAFETASVSSNEEHQPTVVSNADGANVVKNLEKLAEEFENLSNQPKFFIGNVAKALGAQQYGSGSQYATFETKNGQIVTIRLADHNAHTSGFDYSGKDNGISIVISAKKNSGINNGGNAHIVEYYYDAIKLRRANGKPLADIVRAIQQSLYSGEFKDPTGLAEREEVNVSSTANEVKFLRTDSGEVYGFTKDGKIYIDPRKATAETPVHEFTHLWADGLRKANPKAWELLKSELEKEKDLFDYVKSLYPELSGDDLMDEVFAHFSGRRGAEEVTSHNRYDEAHLKSISKIPSMLENAVFLGEEANTKGNRKFDSYRYYAVGLNIDGVDYTAKIVIGVKQGKKYYDHRLTQLEKSTLIDMINQPASGFTTAENASLPPYANGKDKRLLSILQVNVEEISQSEQKMREILDEMKRRRGYDSNTDYQGSLAFNGAAPSRNAYFDSKTDRMSAFKSGEFEGDYSLGDYMDNGLDNNDLGWQLANPIAASGRDKATLESIRNLMNVVKNKDRRIKMYRAVDASIKENKFRNGDWITPTVNMQKDI